LFKLKTLEKQIQKTFSFSENLRKKISENLRLLMDATEVLFCDDADTDNNTINQHQLPRGRPPPAVVGPGRLFLACVVSRPHLAELAALNAKKRASLVEMGESGQEARRNHRMGMMAPVEPGDGHRIQQPQPAARGGWNVSETDRVNFIRYRKEMRENKEKYIYFAKKMLVSRIMGTKR
jgi:hypothetical protein